MGKASKRFVWASGDFTIEPAAGENGTLPPAIAKLLGDHFGRTAEGVEWVSEAAYQLLGEADRSKLVAKKVPDKHGVMRTVYVRPDTSAGADQRTKDAHGEDATSLVSRAIREPEKLNAAEAKELSAIAAGLPKEQLRQLAVAMGQRLGGKKQELAERLVEHVRAQGAGAAKGAAKPKAPKPKKAAAKVPTPAQQKASADLDAAVKAASAGLTRDNLRALVNAEAAAMVVGVDVGRDSLTGENAIGRVLDAAAEDGGEVLRHGMTVAEKTRSITLDGTAFHYTATPSGRAAAAQTLAMLARADLPAKLWAVNKSVNLTTQKNKDDPHWEREYKMPGFIATATGGDGHVVVYNNLPVGPSTLAHEGGHNLAKATWGATRPPADSEYGRAQQAEPPVSAYGAKSPSEDFAEAVVLYTGANRELFRQAFPKKYAALQAIFGDTS